jgi:hypothetical protein
LATTPTISNGEYTMASISIRVLILRRYYTVC